MLRPIETKLSALAEVCIVQLYHFPLIIVFFNIKNLYAPLWQGKDNVQVYIFLLNSISQKLNYISERVLNFVTLFRISTNTKPAN